MERGRPASDRPNGVPMMPDRVMDGISMSAFESDAHLKAVVIGSEAALTLWPSRPGEFHPEPLTDPDLTLSRHPARATARRLPPSIEYRVPPVAG